MQCFTRLFRPCPRPKGRRSKPIRASIRCLLPGERSYFRYAGSLTIPPCGENIEWSLLRAPIEVAEADIAAFAKLYAMNARPLQKDSRRYVLQSG